MITINLCFKLGLNLSTEELEETLRMLGEVDDDNAMDVPRYMVWFNEHVQPTLVDRP